jgi:hypothetical protein
MSENTSKNTSPFGYTSAPAKTSPFAYTTGGSAGGSSGGSGGGSSGGSGGGGAPGRTHHIGGAGPESLRAEEVEDRLRAFTRGRRRLTRRALLSQREVPPGPTC